MTEKIFPLPVVKNKFGQDVSKISINDYYRQISEEVLEAFQAATLDKVNHVLEYEGCGQWVDPLEDIFCPDKFIGNAEAEELADIITCCVTRLAIIGYDEEKRQALYQAVNEKNRRRGYFGE